MDENLKSSILTTVKYFDLFDYPLSALEIYKNLWQQKTTFEELLNTLDRIESLESSEGFYFSPGKRELVKTRKERFSIAEEKIKKVKWLLKLISKMPFVRAVFICNNLSYLNASDDSDIDLAIITKKNRIWTSRFACTFLMKVLGQRPKANNQKNKICLSFFITENNLDLKKYAYPQDIHFVYWVSQFLPIYWQDNLKERFFEANNWLKEYTPNWMPFETNERWQLNRASLFKKIKEFFLKCWFGDKWESLLKKLQLTIIPKKLKNLSKEDNSNVIISDSILKFHDKDNRLEISKKWLQG